MSTFFFKSFSVKDLVVSSHNYFYHLKIVKFYKIIHTAVSRGEANHTLGFSCEPSA